MRMIHEHEDVSRPPKWIRLLCVVVVFGGFAVWDFYKGYRYGHSVTIGILYVIGGVLTGLWVGGMPYPSSGKSSRRLNTK